MDNPIVISIAKSKKEIQEALHLVRQQYAAYYRTRPKKIPRHIFVARSNDTIVGTVAIDVSDPPLYSPLPLEGIYTFKKCASSLLHKRKCIVQYSRWAVIAPNVSEALAYGTATIALSVDKTVAWLEAKPRAAERLRHMGIPLSPLLCAQLNIDRVSREDAPYYMTPPLPQFFIMKTIEIKNATADAVRRLIQQRKVAFDPQLHIAI